MYDIGLGVPQDCKEAMNWWRLAAEQGNVFAQEKLAWKYVLGEGVPQDDVMAYMWLDIAASNDFAAGRKVAIQQRDAIARRMTAGQIAKALELARKYTANNFTGCLRLRLYLFSGVAN